MDVTRAPNLSDAFAIIKRTDPKLYARMERSEWIVQGGIPDSMKGKGYGVTGELAADQDGTHEGDQATMIDIDLINQFANQEHVDPNNFAADVLVHEFAHTPDGGQPSKSTSVVKNEIPAFDAGTAFAKKLPNAYDAMVLTALSESTKAEVIKDGGYNFDQ